MISVWDFAGMLPLDVSGRITFYFERFLTSTVEGIADIVSRRTTAMASGYAKNEDTFYPAIPIMMKSLNNPS